MNSLAKNASLDKEHSPRQLGKKYRIIILPQHPVHIPFRWTYDATSKHLYSTWASEHLGSHNTRSPCRDLVGSCGSRSARHFQTIWKVRTINTHRLAEVKWERFVSIIFLLRINHECVVLFFLLYHKPVCKNLRWRWNIELVEVHNKSTQTSLIHLLLPVLVLQ